MTKKAVLTGSTGGLGQEIAQILAQQGWSLILMNRNDELSKRQADGLARNYPGQSFESYTVDLMDIESLNTAASEVIKAHPEIDALYNIAGLLTDKKVMSAQNIESHFAVNTVAPYVLIQALKPALEAAASAEAPALIVNFSSEAVKAVKSLDAAELPDPKVINGLMGAYAKSKLALNAISVYLSEELLADNIYIYAADPGATKTKMTDGNAGMPWIIRFLAPFLFNDAKKQAHKLLDAVDGALQARNTALFITNGKIKDHPALVHDKSIQTALNTLVSQYLFQG